MRTLALAARLARRELRGGLRGFGVFIACLALGVAAIAASGSLKASIHTALQADARALLGGDLVLRLAHRPAAAEQLEFLGDNAVVAETIEMRAMARAESGRRALIELKGVAAAYPLAGSLETEPALPPADLFARRDGVWGAAVDANLLTRLGLSLGERVTVGDATLEIRAVIRREPDRVASVFALGPRVMAGLDAVTASGLVQPGSLIRYAYLLDLPPPLAAAEFAGILEQRFPQAGWQIRTPEDAAPGIKRFVDNMNLFLTLVGLTALLVGGVGVGNAVKAFVDGRTRTVAILKCVGAPARLVLAAYGLQVGAIALVGIAAGTILGAAVAPLAVVLLGDTIPVQAEAGLHPMPLLLAAGFGILVAVVFGLWPLSRAAAIPPAALFRDIVAHVPRGPRRRAMLAVAVATAALAALTVASAEHRGLALWFIGVAALFFALFRGVAALLAAWARRMSHRQGLATSGVWRLGLARLHRPGAATGSVVLSLGLGLTVLVAIALIEANLRRQIAERMPEEAPAFFFIDIQPEQAARFDALVGAVEGAGTVRRAPMVRGRITQIDGVPVEQAAVAAEAEWAVRGDRGLTMAADPPEASRVVAGTWWPADYQGPPLLSLTADIARGLGLAIGDTLTVNVLGRDVTATITSLREVDWSSMAMNFALVLSPGALAGAPHTHIATVRAVPAAEDALERAVTDALPNVSAIRVRQALEAVEGMLQAIGLAARAAGVVTLAAGALVLAGAIAAGRRLRVYEAVVLKALGATRRDLVAAYLVEYGLLGLATGVLAGLAGSAIAWAVLRFVMRADWVFLPGLAAATAAACAGTVLVLGYLGTWRVLAAPVAPHLRNE